MLLPTPLRSLKVRSNWGLQTSEQLDTIAYYDDNGINKSCDFSYNTHLYIFKIHRIAVYSGRTHMPFLQR